MRAFGTFPIACLRHDRTNETRVSGGITNADSYIYPAGSNRISSTRTRLLASGKTRRRSGIGCVVPDPRVRVPAGPHCGRGDDGRWGD